MVCLLKGYTDPGLLYLEAISRSVDYCKKSSKRIIREPANLTIIPLDLSDDLVRPSKEQFYLLTTSRTLGILITRAPGTY
jgi:hypothetical protein